MRAVQQMLAFLYHIVRKSSVPKNVIYEQFFQAPFVRRFCEQEGIEEATIEAAKRRCPFLLNILSSLGLIRSERSDVEILKLMLIPEIVRADVREPRTVTDTRIRAVRSAWPQGENQLQGVDLSILRELFGASFLTSSYHLRNIETNE